MNELNNTATSVGTYNNIPTALTSNTSVVNLVEGLTLEKEADKTNWVDGNLKYTITIKNEADKDYVTPKVTDIIDTDKVEFVKSSVTINGVAASEQQYNYEEASHTLTINLDTITPSSSSTITFLVTKKNG